MDRERHRFTGFHRMILCLCEILYILELCSGYVVPSGRGDQLRKLSSYEIVTPYRLAGRERRQAQTTTQDGHLEEAAFILEAFGKDFILDVQLNENVFPSRYVERHYAEDGGAVTKKPHTQHHCYYHGSVRGSLKSSVAISTCSGISGVISSDGETYFIEPLQESSEEHVVYRPQDRINPNTWVFDVDDSHMEDQVEKMPKSRSRRDVHSETKYIELVLVNDYQEYQRWNSNVTKVEERSKEMANIMDMIYRPMNMRIALVGVITWTQGDQFTVSSNPSTTMAEFQRWRKDELLADISNDNAQFITGVSFDGSTVGMASLGTMCSDERSGGVSQDHDHNVAVVASTIAHEMGHNLGFYHDDDTSCQCDAPSNVGCVMEPSSGPIPPTNFSTCSYDYLQSSLEKGLGACLYDYPNMIFDGPICGNGFLESGEQCDCGTPEECSNDCCIAATCRLHENATCAIGECCEMCQLKKAGESCRPILNDCDLPEYCTGMSEECPANVYIQNGQSCADKKDATCYDGQCLTYDDQCEDIWGSGAKVAHEACFKFNEQGSAFGNCGTAGSSFKACQKEHVKCGKLMCEGGSDYPILTSLAKASQGYIWDSSHVQHTCKSASIDLGQDVPDPGYVAMGSLCQAGFVCSDFQCQNLSALNIKSCPNNCNGHGVCNSKNNCHCDAQWAPPLCNSPGYGGSIDSGPARATDQPGGPGTGLVVVLLVIFLVVLPGLTLLAILVYCKRDQVSRIISKGATKEKYTSSRQYSKDTSASSSSKPSRPAPPKPTIQHFPQTEETTVFRYPPPSTHVPQVAVRPPAPPSNKPKPAPVVLRPVPPKIPSAPKPARPSPSPPVPPTKPPSPKRTVSPPPVPTPPKPSAKHSSNKPQFKLPPPIEAAASSSAPPKRPVKPALRPPPPNARDALKPAPVTRTKPNVNRNNSKELDESSASSSIPSSDNKTHPLASEFTKPTVARKPVPSKKPVIPGKPSIPSRPPPPNRPGKKDPVV